MRDDLRIDVTITDLALCIAEGSKGFCFPGPAQIPPEFRDYCGALVQRCTEKRREHAGKTTTASATVRSRFEAFAGMAYTLEDLPEHPLNAWKRGQGGGLGYCAQTLVGPDMDSVNGWSASMAGARR